MRASTITRLRRCLRREAGFTLAEVMIAMMIASLVMVVFMTVLSSVQQSVTRQDYLTRANDQARMAMEELDHEIRSGNVLYDPALENNGQASCPGCLPNYTMRIYTQTNSPTRGNPGYMCALWTINDEGQLLKNMWYPLPMDPNPTGWRVVAEGIVNRDAASGGPAFELAEGYGNRTVDIALVVNPNPGSRFSRTVHIEMSSTGRNTSYGFPEDVCNATPT